MNSSSGFASVLHAAAPAPDRADKLDLYGWLIGDWDAEITAYSVDGKSYSSQGEIHAGWILEGRAIQDVWMIPRLKDRKPAAEPMPIAGNWYGTTLRIYDPTIDAWRIYWVDPATNAYRCQIGRRQGKDIVQEGKTKSGAHSLELYGDRARFVPLARRDIDRRQGLAADGRGQSASHFNVKTSRWGPLM